METLKGIGGFLVAAAFFLGAWLLFLWAMNGLVWVAVNGLPLLNKLGAIVFFLCLIMVPLSFLAGLRKYTGPIFLISSYVFGASTWLYGFLYTYVVWGLWPLIIGLLLGFIGVVPIGMLAALVNAHWIPLARV